MVSFMWLALIGIIFKIDQGTANIPIALTLWIATSIVAIYGAKLVAKSKSNALKTLFGLLFLYVSLKYILVYFKIYI